MTVHLSKRELEVLNHLVEGKSSQEVAEAIYVSKSTVDFHLGNIYTKLKVNNRIQALRRVVIMGIVTFTS